MTNSHLDEGNGNIVHFRNIKESNMQQLNNISLLSEHRIDLKVPPAEKERGRESLEAL